MSSNDIGGGSLDLFFFNDDTSSLIEDVIDSSHTFSRASNFGQEDRFLETRACGEFTSVIDSSGSGDDLTTSSVDGIGVQDNIHNIDSDGSHVFVGHDGFFGGPLESIFHRVSDFTHELDSFGGIDQTIGSLIFGSERPDFKGIIFFPTISILQVSGSFFGFLFASTFTGFDVFSKTFSEGFGGSVDSVMFVGGLGKADLAGVFSDGFFEGDDGVGFDDFNVGEFSFEIMETNFNV